MKKVLSVMLAAMMVASLFAINASAAIPTTYDVVEGYVPDTELYLQDFSNIATNTDYTERLYDGTVSVEADGTMKLTGAYRTCGTMQTTAKTPITTGQFVYEFDFMRDDDLSVDTQIFVTFQRAANASNANAHIKKYGVVIPVRTVGMRTIDGVNLEDNINPEKDIDAHKWYTFRLTIDEVAFAEVGGLQEAAYLKHLMKIERKAADETEWTVLSHSGYSHFKADECRIYGSGAVAVTSSEEVTFGVARDAYAEQYESTGYYWDEETQKYVAGTEVIKSEDMRNLDLRFDNIRIYIPGSEGEVVAKDLEINKGVAYTMPADDEIALTVEEKKVDGVVQEGVPATKYTDRKINWAYEPASFVGTFDAVNNVAGGPLSVAFAGKAASSYMMTIAPTETGKVYSYKAVYSSNGTNTSVDALYRKAADETEWTLLTKGRDADWWNGYNGSGSANLVRVYCYAGYTGNNAASNCELGTSWTVNNIQVTDSYAMTGTATVDADELTVDLNTVVADAVAMVAAVYDGDRMVAAQAVDVAAFANEKEIKVPFDAAIANPTVKIFVLDGMGTMVPMDIPVDITAAID